MLWRDIVATDIRIVVWNKLKLIKSIQLMSCLQAIVDYQEKAKLKISKQSRWNWLNFQSPCGSKVFSLLTSPNFDNEQIKVVWNITKSRYVLELEKRKEKNLMLAGNVYGCFCNADGMWQKEIFVVFSCPKWRRMPVRRGFVGHRQPFWWSSHWQWWSPLQLRSCVPCCSPCEQDQDDRWF